MGIQRMGPSLPIESIQECFLEEVSFGQVLKDE